MFGFKYVRGTYIFLEYYSEKFYFYRVTNFIRSVPLVSVVVGFINSKTAAPQDRRFTLGEQQTTK